MKTTTNCRKPEVVDVLKELVVFMINSNCVSKKQNTLNPIMKAFEGGNIETQFCVLRHRTDFYFHDW